MDTVKQTRRVLCVGGIMDGKYVYLTADGKFFRKAAGAANCRNRVDSYRLQPERRTHGYPAVVWSERMVLERAK